MTVEVEPPVPPDSPQDVTAPVAEESATPPATRWDGTEVTAALPVDDTSAVSVAAPQPAPVLPPSLPAPLPVPVSLAVPAVPPVRPRGVVRRVATLLGIVLLSGTAGGLVGAKVATDSRSPVLPALVPGQTTRPEGSVAQIAAATLPSVVTVRVKDAEGSGTGSGFVIDTDGHVLTNNHVVSRAASGGAISVQLSDGTQQDAEIVGRDITYDLAVLHIRGGSALVPLQFGRSSDVVVGDGVIAVGAPLGLEATVTTGIVSALGRPVTAGDGTEQSYISAIQTDAAINPGNSGGPLVDMAGHVIGINSAIARLPGSTSSSGSIGLGFAIPSDKAHATAAQLISTGKATHPVIGVKIDTAYDGEGVRVSTKEDAVTSGGPADLAGVRAGDVILRFEGRVVSTPDELIVAVRARDVGDQVTLEIRRDGTTRTVTMTLVAAGG
ncbi:MAG: trypsin-like peptidase domain-containing protein [Dermatophilaceae bacterium]